MSDELTSFDGMEPEVEVGSTEYDNGHTEAPDTPILSIDEYAGYKVPVKLDGEELQVPLSEAIAGYQRQADYTRKTQELSQQKEQFQFATALQAALDSDPASTLELLSQHYGISQKAAAEMMEQEDEYLDPVEKKYRELDRRIAQFEEEKSQQQIEREIAGLQDRYPDFDVKEVVQVALQRDTTDLEGIYKQLAFDKMVNEARMAKLGKERQQQIEESVLESKRIASIINGGSSATASTTSDSFEPITSIAEAWAANIMSNPNFDALLSTTLANYRDQLTDNIFTARPLTYFLQDKGRIRMLNGGTKIVEPLIYGQNTTVASYSGYDTISLTAQTGITAAEYDWKQYAASIAISGIEEAKNNGEQEIINLLEAKIMQAEESMREGFNTMFFADGTGNSGKDWNGLGNC
jgi:hypothetical protein